MQRYALLLQLLASFAFAASPNIPTGATPTRIEVDNAGNGYVAGETFVLKYRLDTGATVYLAILENASLRAIAVDDNGALYATGYGGTLPRISGQDVRPIAGTTGTARDIGAFVAKLNPAGAVAYATLLSSQPTADVAVNTSGEVYVTGDALEGEMPATPGAAVSLGGNVRTNFVAKLNAAGDRLLLVERGIGGSGIALDAAGNIYVTGTSGGKQDPPISANAFQRTHSCCGEYQHVAKLDPTGTTLLWSTYLNGTAGARPGGLQIDGQGNVYVAGSTTSADFPVTEGVIGPKYLATRPSYLSDFAPILSNRADTGFVAKLDPTGSSLLFSTYLGGSRSDWVGAMRLRDGQLYLSGFIGSEDLQGPSPRVMQECLPGYFVTTMQLDGRSLGYIHVAKGSGSALAVGPDGFAYTADFAVRDLRNPPAPIYCIADAAGRNTISSVAPGQLISIFGPDLATDTETATPGADGVLTDLHNSRIAMFGSFLGKFLYASKRQVNIVVPYQVAGLTNVTLGYSSVAGGFGRPGFSIPLSVVPRALSAFQVLAEINYCAFNAPIGRIGTPAYLLRDTILVHNEDGSQNSCTNPARAGSIATFFVNGGGVTGALPVTGLIADRATPVSIEAAVTRGTLLGVTLDPGSVNGVWRVQVRIPSDAPTGPMEISAKIGGQKVTAETFFVWTAP